ncbi:hypothetical protein J6O86_05535 [bacterium]|nr:hypothetical protein [bacterium]
MTLSVQPALKTSYTERGNEYKESNIGKYAAGAGAIGSTAFYGAKYGVKGAKKLYSKAKTIKMDIPKIQKPDFKAIKDAAKNFKVPTMQAVKNFVKAIPAKLMAPVKASAEFIKNTAKKVNLTNIKKAGKSVVDFVKSNAKKVNMANIKKAVQPAIDFAKKPSVKYGAGVAAGIIGVVALGFVADAIANKISQYKADHQNILLKK